MGFGKFYEQYEKSEKEILVLRHAGGGGVKFNDYWVISAYFLAYVDIETGNLYQTEGRLVWPVSDEEQKAGGCFSRFNDERIYRVKVRTYKAVQADMPEAISNQFYVTELMEENVHCPELEEILAEYQKPVVWQDDLLGELTLDKRFSMFEGNFLWRGQAICISLEVDKEDEDSWTQAIKAMGQMSAEQDRWDKDMRGFAADKLTPLANDWQDDEDESKPDITEQDFARRIQLQTLSVDPDGSFSAYYDDDDMFWGHVVVVYGTLEGGITSAQMEG